MGLRVLIVGEAPGDALALPMRMREGTATVGGREGTATVAAARALTCVRARLQMASRRRPTAGGGSRTFCAQLPK